MSVEISLPEWNKYVMDRARKKREDEFDALLEIKKPRPGLPAVRLFEE